MDQRSEFSALARLIRRLTPFHETLPESGVSYKGFPQWLTTFLLQSLQQEGQDRVAGSINRSDHLLGFGGPLADALAISPDVIAFVARHVGPVRPTGIASYLFYNFAGGGIKPHVDTEVFSVNLMLMLKHVVPEGATQGDCISLTPVFVIPSRSPLHSDKTRCKVTRRPQAMI